MLLCSSKTFSVLSDGSSLDLNYLVQMFDVELKCWFAHSSLAFLRRLVAHLVTFLSLLYHIRTSVIGTFVQVKVEWHLAVLTGR